MKTFKYNSTNDKKETIINHKLNLEKCRQKYNPFVLFTIHHIATFRQNLSHVKSTILSTLTLIAI